MYQYYLNKFISGNTKDIENKTEYKIVRELQKYLSKPTKYKGDIVDRYYLIKQKILNLYNIDIEKDERKVRKKKLEIKDASMPILYFSTAELMVIHNLIYDLPKYSNIQLDDWDIPELVYKVAKTYWKYGGKSTLECLAWMCKELDVFTELPLPKQNGKKEEGENANTTE